MNQVVFEQQKAITALEQQLTGMRTRVSGMGEPQPIEKPPHY
ncbi:MAG: SlyX family protein [Polyangiaceae bacterium]